MQAHILNCNVDNLHFKQKKKRHCTLQAAGVAVKSYDTLF